MENNEIINRLLESPIFPVNYKYLLNRPDTKVNFLLEQKDWLLHLYNLRLEWISQQRGYEKVAADLKEIIEKLRAMNGKVYLINIINTEQYLLFFLDELLISFIGLLDLTGLGNTKAFMVSKNI